MSICVLWMLDMTTDTSIFFPDEILEGLLGDRSSSRCRR